MAADDATEPALEDAFGTLLGPEDDEYFDIVEEKRQRREARFRAAVLHARETYQAKVDSHAWFFEGSDPAQPITDLAHREMDSKTTQKLESSLVYLYHHGLYAEALEGACALLERLHVLFPLKVPWQPETKIPILDTGKLDKEATMLAHSGTARVTIDVALRCLLKLDSGSREPTDRDAALVAAALERARQEDDTYARLWRNGQPDVGVIPKITWSTHPGLAESAGNVCIHVGRFRSALEAYALVLGARGRHWRPLLRVARAFSALAPSTKDPELLRILACASASAALRCCTPHRALANARSIANGEVLTDADLHCLSQAPQITARTPRDADIFYASRLVEEQYLSPEGATGILLTALTKSGGVQALAVQLPKFLAASRDANSSENARTMLHGLLDTSDDAGEAPRSVRTL